MTDFYTAAAPNGFKVSILFHELKIPFQPHTLDLKANQQRDPEFLALNPIGKIPVIVDRADSGDSLVLTESNAILVYLAEKAKSSLLPATGSARARVLESLFFQASDLGPVLGQLFMFRILKMSTTPDAETRAAKTTARYLGVLDDALSKTPWVTGADYTIADIAHYPWLTYHQALGLDLDACHHLRDWYERMSSRPAVQTGMKFPPVAV